MNGGTIAVAPSAYPLLIKQLLHTPLAQTPHQEIVYRDVRDDVYMPITPMFHVHAWGFRGPQR